MKNLKRYFLALASGIVVALAMTAPPHAVAQETALNMRLTQRNAADNGNIDRFIAPPAAGTNCLFYFNGSTVLPTCANIGTGLVLTDGVLSSTASATPTFAAVATSGAYVDLSGRPVLATVATSGSYADLSNKPTIPAAPPARAFSLLNRALATCFQASATRDTQVNYVVDVTATLTLASSARGSAYLRTYADSACTTGQQTLIGGTGGLPATLSVTVGLQSIGSVTLPAIIPAGAWARLETVADAGTPTFAMRTPAQEVQL